MKKGNTLAVVFMALALAVCSCNVPGKPATDSNDSANETKEQTAGNEDVKPMDVAELKMAKDFTLDDIKGKKVNLMSEVKKNKITILDFWASWCPPCMREVPNLVDIYDRYGEDGLGIVGVSLDESKDDWKNTVESMGMKWVQVSDLKGGESPVVRLYNVQSIPHILVIDSEGRILSEGLTGTELEEFIADHID